MFKITLFILLTLLGCHAAPLISYAAKLPDQTSKWADGDSFPVTYQDPDKGPATITVRLYFIDCPESSATSKNDLERLREQARYFGIEKGEDMLKFGKLATKRTHQLLQKPFTIHTSFASALGRSKKQRYYTTITLSDGSDLITTLIKEGLARVKGTARKLPDGTSAEEFRAKLSDLELVSAISKVGIWSKSDPEALVLMRAQARRENEELNQFVRGGVFAVVSPENPVDINNDSKPRLEQIKGIGDATSRKIIRGRPYKTLNELVTKKILSSKALNKFAKFLTVKPLRKTPPQS